MLLGSVEISCIRVFHFEKSGAINGKYGTTQLTSGILVTEKQKYQIQNRLGKGIKQSRSPDVVYVTTWAKVCLTVWSEEGSAGDLGESGDEEPSSPLW